MYVTFLRSPPSKAVGMMGFLMHEPQQLRNRDVRTFADICVFLQENCALFVGKLSAFFVGFNAGAEFPGYMSCAEHGPSLFIFKISGKSNLFQRLQRSGVHQSLL